MIEPIEIKTGATFSVPFLVLLPAGSWSAASEIRKGDDTLVGELAVTLEPLATPDADGNTHAGVLEASSVQTVAWEHGSWRADVRFSDDSTPPAVLTSDPFFVLVKKGVTHG